MKINPPKSAWIFAFIIGVPLSGGLGAGLGSLIFPLGAAILANGAQFFIDLNQGTLMLDVFAASIGLGGAVGGLISVAIVAVMVSKTVQPHSPQMSQQSIVTYTVSGFLLWGIGLPTSMIIALMGLMVGAWLIAFLGLMVLVLSFLVGGAIAGIPFRLVSLSTS